MNFFASDLDIRRDDLVGRPELSSLCHPGRRQIGLDLGGGGTRVRQWFERIETRGQPLDDFTVAPKDGTSVQADIWLRCYGVVPNSDYLGEVLAPARNSDGFIEVTPTMQVKGQTSVFAIGDLSTADTKKAAHVARQAATVPTSMHSPSVMAS